MGQAQQRPHRPRRGRSRPPLAHGLTASQVQRHGSSWTARWPGWLSGGPSPAWRTVSWPGLVRLGPWCGQGGRARCRSAGGRCEDGQDGVHGFIAVRDSKRPTGPALAFTEAALTAFLPHAAHWLTPTA
ncbi:DUF397 domain-containing protein [Streptomyces goshikiensis]|uniref:DUF397 domain-containing protein n=1 Tax=Streptomyces goshikiensis TaxID=1942 RepID=UPI003659B14D